MLKTAGKLAPEAKPRVVNMLIQAFCVYSRVAYTIFPHTFSEKWHVKNAWRECATFAWGMRKSTFPILCVQSLACYENSWCRNSRVSVTPSINTLRSIYVSENECVTGPITCLKYENTRTAYYRHCLMTRSTFYSIRIVHSTEPFCCFWPNRNKHYSV